MKKTNKGITLIALIITIIVLIILSGVAIAMLRGDNGIVTKSTTAQSKNSESTATERIKLAYTAVKSEIETQLTDNASYDALEDSNFLKLVNIVRKDLEMNEIALLNATAIDGNWTVTPGGASTDTERTIKITYTDSNIQENEGKVEKVITVTEQNATMSNESDSEEIQEPSYTLTLKIQEYAWSGLDYDACVTVNDNEYYVDKNGNSNITNFVKIENVKYFNIKPYGKDYNWEILVESGKISLNGSSCVKYGERIPGEQRLCIN